MLIHCVLIALLPVLGVWLRIPTAGILPTSRDGHACATIGEDMFIHGGFAATVSSISVAKLALNVTVSRKRDHLSQKLIP